MVREKNVLGGEGGVAVCCKDEMVREELLVQAGETFRNVDYGGAEDEDEDEDDDDDAEVDKAGRGRYAADPKSVRGLNMPMPWSVAARQRSMCKRFVRLFQLVQFMMNSAFRSLLLKHMATLTDIVEPGTGSQGEGDQGYLPQAGEEPIANLRRAPVVICGCIA